MSLCSGGIAPRTAAENPAIPGHFSDRARVPLWNNAAIPRIPFTSRARPAPTIESRATQWKKIARRPWSPRSARSRSSSARARSCASATANSYDVEVVSTGSLGLDIALGVGGLPSGRVIEIYGPESSGKTTLALQVIAEAQRAGGTAAFVDAEHALDPPMPRSSASTSTTCSSRSPTTASRPSRSPTCWCARAPSTSSSSTRSRR